MSMRHAPVAVLIACLAGCAAIDLKVPTQATAKVATTMKAPEAKADAAPAAPPVDGKVAPATTTTVTAAQPAKPKLHIPEDFGVGLPSALVGEAGGSIISNDGHSEHLLSLPSPTVHYGAGSAVETFGAMYQASRKGANALLAIAKANEDDLLAGKEVPLAGIPGIGSFSMSLQVKDDHGELSFWSGEANSRHRFLWLSFTDDKHGQGLFRPLSPKHPYAFATHFDLDKGQGDADAYFTAEDLLGQARLHIAVTSVPAAPAGQPRFKLRVGGYLHQSVFLDDGAVVASANVLSDNTAAAIYGVRLPGASAFVFKDGLLGDAAPGAHGLYLAIDGSDLAAAKLTDALKAAVPADDDVAPPTFADPAAAASPDAPFQDPVFSFPAATP